MEDQYREGAIEVKWEQDVGHYVVYIDDKKAGYMLKGINLQQEKCYSFNPTTRSITYGISEVESLYLLILEMTQDLIVENRRKHASKLFYKWCTLDEIMPYRIQLKYHAIKHNIQVYSSFDEILEKIENR